MALRWSNCWKWLIRLCTGKSSGKSNPRNSGTPSPDTDPAGTEIANDCPDLVLTNYWDSPHARRELLYVSANAGVLRRVLEPKAGEHVLPEMASAKPVTIEASIQAPQCWNLVFEEALLHKVGQDTPAP